MPHYTLRTLSGDIDYVLRRRSTSGPWSYDAHWQGKRLRDSTKSRDLATAKEIAEEALLAVTQSSPVAPSYLTLQQACDACVNDLYPEHDTDRKRTRGNLKHRLGNFCKKDRGALNVMAISHDAMRRLIQKFIDERKQSVGGTSVDNDRRAISRLCSWLMKRHVQWPANPALGKQLETPPQIRRIKDPASDDAADKMTAAAFEHPAYHTVFPVLVLMQSGFRPIGCTRVRWCDMTTDSKPMVKVREKNVETTIPLSQWALTELLRYKAAHPPPSDEVHIFPYQRDWATEMIARLRKKVAPGFTLYALRRRAFLRLYQADVSPQKAAKIMRCSVATALRHYVQLERMDAHDAAETLAPTPVNVTKPSQKRRR